MSRFIKVFISIIISITLFNVLNINSDINLQCRINNTLRLYGINLSYDYSPDELEFIRSAEHSDIFISDGSFSQMQEYMTYMAYYKIQGNVREAFEKGGGKIRLVNNLKSKFGNTSRVTNGSFTVLCDGKYEISLSSTCGSYKKIQSILRHEVGHFVNWHLSRKPEHDEFWKSESSKKYFQDFMNENASDNPASESFAEVAALYGIKRQLFNFIFPEAVDFVQEKWDEV